MGIYINFDSIYGIVGSIITLTFAIYYFTSYLSVRKDRLFLLLSFFMLTVFVYLAGYSVYSSSVSPDAVRSWTKICYSGGALIIYSSFLLSSEIINKSSPRLHAVYLVLTIVLAAVIFIPGDFIFTNVINPDKSHSSVIKGSGFIFLLLTMFAAFIGLLSRLAAGMFKNKESVYEVTPLLTGLSIWFLEAMINGIFGAVLSILKMNFSIGPIVMTFCLSLYSGRVVHRKDLELARIKKENENIYNSLIYDQLSTLYSRQYFLETFEQRQALISRDNSEDCLMFIDIDNFKSVNDTLGHSRGDLLITYTGKILKENTRKSDICTRYGGDEFVILLENCKPDNAIQIAENIRSRFKKNIHSQLKFFTGDKNISLSIGIVFSKDWPESTAEIIQRADVAMYKAKQKGKNRTELYQEMKAEV